ncbi:ATP-dependent DNA ligase LigD ligase module /ATP-dependent DNA ligase LigD phosphoesterase module /ATP-dependent DNA ligase LigD polymerase module [Georgenia satyanarayanai]|uniref:DNA ligase (ATP) n=1 Tax=Georgenia satyanarayanai TaxID=860221 RepID=A0A2Y9BUX2_9MICO|nr:ATP-dependent DNA ligase [Georgenia satyanarayanai]PYG01582.1 ATP-dependent DNA ligase LigD ligase module /ATP-dependent DNA ligase LigD phosphoesterase module /ATP-dependent DNA ligase LigD polymerase module [Georgenia satyanarayanai]SSA36382.1 ATP-dependent DNA ligase LigD ligase module /ATP-dependent DNA ligase LigD phosphoesterase module /ATP-dependent DNA ligase LigD polymerase module [Georgenia satyanarayanai]
MVTDGGPVVVQVDGHRLRLTNLDKVLYPATGTTKADVLEYYSRIAPVMLPHCAGRPATRKRWPNGTGTGQDPGQVFFQKNVESSAPDWVERAEIQHSDHVNTYPLVDSAATLAWLAQVAALEVHVPQWRVGSDGKRRNPDRLVLDLDPGEGAGLAECVEVAVLARDILQGMGLDPVPVTSGSKGIHLYSALPGTATSEEVSEVAKELARTLETDHPDLVVSNMKKELRRGKVLVDWSQNNGNKTTIAPYSLRGREQPMVAAPRTWRELTHPRLRHLDLREVVERVERRGDPMAALAEAADQAGGQPKRDRLEVYRAKRDAARTPEPVPAVVAPDDGTLAFVIQEHHASRLHWDLRLAHDGVLVSWALPKCVPTSPRKNHLAVQTEDHPMEYLTFSGTIPTGEYGAGEMTIWDTGTYTFEKWREGKEVIVTLTGQEDGGLAGPDGPGRTSRFALIHTGGRSEGEDNHWLIHLMSTPDGAGGSGKEPAGEDADDGGGRARRGSPSTGEDTDDGGGRARRGSPSEGEKDDDGGRGAGGTRPGRERAGSGTSAPGAPPEFVVPMLATLSDATVLDASAEWAVEMKWDGVRAVVLVEDGTVRLVGRSGREVTDTYPELAGLAECVDARTAVLDGEIVALTDTGRPDFGLLQQRIQLTDARAITRAAGENPVRLMLFDALAVDGTSLLRRTYDERREALEEVVDPSGCALVEIPPAFDGDLEAAVAASRQWRLEGVVAKRRDSAYTPGRRSRSWLKIKHASTQEAVVVGWRPGQGTRAGKVGSLLLALPDDGELRYIGRVGTGFSEREAATWARELGRDERTTAPLEVPRPEARDARWVTPRRVAEVEFAEWTSTGRLRHPRWRGWRPDKEPADVVRES